MALGIGLFAFSQQRAVVQKSLKDISFKRPIHNTITETNNFQTTANPYVSSNSNKAVNEEQIGATRYDLQTNNSVQNRFYRYADGTMAGTWTYGISDPSFADRGTGYNYFDGTSWAAMPTERIESVRTGWPSYAPYGADGEIVVAHNGSTGLNIAIRTSKGTGTWTESELVGPVTSGGTTALLWPRMTTSGPTHNIIHILACTDQAATGSHYTYQGQELALVYSRSTDGGVTWDPENVVLSAMDSLHYVGFGGDTYDWAESKGDTLAFIVGDNWIDLFLMKSTDGGDTWTKTVIFQHPYPMWTDAVLTLDTPYVCDGGHSVTLDNNGDAHVFFGIMRVMNDVADDDATSYFPYIDGLGYWNESMTTYTDVTPDVVYANGTLPGFLYDIDGNDTIDFLAAVSPALPFGAYYLSLTSMPNAAIDADGNIFLVYASYMETLNDGVQGYRHLIARKSEDGGATWSNFSDLNAGIMHEYDECVFPSVAPITDENIYLIYQADANPGLAVRGDEDLYGDNQIIYLSVAKTDIGTNIGINEVNSNVFSVSQIYPNPFKETATINVTLSNTSKLSLEIYNIMGQKVYGISKGNVGAGTHTFTINANNLNSGIYFYTVRANGNAVTKKMIVE